MIISDPTLKRLIYHLLTFEDAVKEDGSFVRRVGYPKSHLSAVVVLKRKIEQDYILHFGDGTKVRYAEVKPEEMQKQIVNEEIKAGDIELSENEVEAVKWARRDRETWIEASEQAIEQLNALK